MIQNRTRLLTFVILIVLFIAAIQGMETKDWVITIFRGLSLGMIIFLVASGLSLIFGLLDVLSLAHGEVFMLGAYVGWTVYVRPDTFVDFLTPLALIGVGFALMPMLSSLLRQRNIGRLTLFAILIVGGIVLFFSLRAYPLSIWSPDVYTESPITYSLALSQERLVLPEAPMIDYPLLVILGIIAGGILVAAAVAAFNVRQGKIAASDADYRTPTLRAAALLVAAMIVYVGNNTITEWLLNLDTTLRFFVAIGVAMALGFLLGTIIEITLIRPLYKRPIYQLMITLGLSFIIIEVVRAIWGRPEFTMPKAALFTGRGDGCPAQSLGDLIQYQCSTVIILDGRIRTYNEIFVILIGFFVLVGVWLLLHRTRIGIIIRAGVQDSEMVEALGINVRQIFTLVFALGTGLATLGGVLAAPSLGLGSDMGTRLLLMALIALAVGGLTSFPGAAAGSILVGLLQQFVIKYGQIGIPIPFMDDVFKPSPPLVPASTVLLMVVVLLALPNGLFGREE